MTEDVLDVFSVEDANPLVATFRRRARGSLPPINHSNRGSP